jgi:hypothetical protein
VREPDLGSRKVEVGREVKQGVVIARIADPRLMLDQLVGKVALANLVERDRCLDVRLVGDALPLASR